jgi:poly(A) polymerase
MATSRPDTSKSSSPSLIQDGTAPAWLTDPRTVAVTAALEARGFAGCVRYVGGCVRNTITGHPVDDIDIATPLTPDEVIEALETAGLRWAPTGVDHGTVTAIVDGTPFEITTLRRDVSTDGRNATVAFTRDWDEDARRRDFRLNSLYADPAGRIYDPTGHGVKDALEGRIVFVGEAMTRVREDYLRILRFFRFYAWYGKGDPDPKAVDACRALKGMLAGRAAERTSKEILKLLAADDPRPSVRLMARTGVLGAVLPGVVDLDRFERLVEIEAQQLFETDAELRLAALLPEGAAKGMSERLRLSNAQRGRLIAAGASTPRIVSWMSGREARRAVYGIGLRAFTDRVKLGWAAGRPSAAGQWRALLGLAETWTPPALPVTGADVAAAGMVQGPAVGEVLREVEDWWIDQDFLDDREQALVRLQAVVKGMMD